MEPFDEKYEVIGDRVRTVADVIEFFYDIIYVEEWRQFYVWRNGVYIYRTEDWINSVVTSICRQREDDRVNLDFENSYKYSTGFVSNIAGMIKGDCLLSKRVFRLYHHLINCKNGIFDINQCTFIPHKVKNPYKDKGYFPFIQLATDYNPDAKCPRIDEFIKQIFKNKWREIYEVVGSYITTDVGYQKAQWIYGFGSNGKGVFSKLVTHLLGRENIMVMPMSVLLKDFSVAEIQNKLLNIVHEIDVDYIQNSGLYKNITGGDDLNAQKKFIQKQELFENVCKLLIACNTIPKCKDDSYGWWRRKMLFPLTKTFIGKHKDKLLINKLTTKRELEGLLNHALNGLLRLKWRDGFIDEDVEKIREKWFLETDPLGKFILDFCVKDGSCLRTEFVYDFNIWRKNNNMPKVGERYVSQHLKKKMNTIELKRKRGAIAAKYVGISLLNGSAKQYDVNKMFTGIPKEIEEDFLDEF